MSDIKRYFANRMRRFLDFWSLFFGHYYWLKMGITDDKTE